jgi:hypothetical protein
MKSGSQGLSITASPSQIETKSGSSIRVTVRLANTSDARINPATESFVLGGVESRFK